MNHCIPRRVPTRYLEELTTRAITQNPLNDTPLPLGVSDPQHIAVTRSKYFGAKPRVLTVSFMETIQNEVADKIVLFANMWKCGIKFERTIGTGDVRISRRSGGYWSYLGTDVLSIPKARQTMNLEGFSRGTPDSEYHRVVPHEFGHTLGFPHEHMRREIVDRIDRQRAYAYFARTSGWSRNTVNSQVLTPLDEQAIIGTATDQASIMCYHLPGSITKDGQDIPGGRSVSDADREFARKMYPEDATEEPEPPPIEPLPNGKEWDELEYEENDWI